MTLQTTGPIKASEIRDEFSGSNPFNLGDYFAGGANVPALSEGINGPIPSSGTIKFSDFYGATDVPPAAISLTVGTQTNVRGFLLSSFGSVSPTTFKGVAIESIFATDPILNPPGRIDVQLNGSHPQFFWNQLVISGGPTLIAMDATTFDGSKWTFLDVGGFYFPSNTTCTFL